jgi:type II secretory ATPase GspE/PulE/Tfp pilus assembly ATPase PilB-like protein
MRKSPDRTLKLTRASLSPDKTGKLARSRLPIDQTTRLPLGAQPGGAQAAAAPSFQWPAPPYYEFDDPAVPGAVAPCVLAFTDGAKAAGTLLDFSPADELLRFQQQNADSVVTIAFSGLLRVDLPAPVTLRQQSLPPTMEQRVFAASNRQPFEVRMKKGEIHQGETVGYIEAVCGLFLYLPDENDRVARCFIPAQAAASYGIGKPLGQMLVEEKLASSDLVDTAVLRQMALRSRRMGEYLTETQIVSQAQLAAAIKRQQAQPVQMLGETLVELGYLSSAQLKDALAIEERNRTLPLGQILADMGVVEPEVINAVMARKLGIPFIDLRAFEVAPEILKKIPSNVAYRYQVVPLAESEKALVIAVDNPMDMTKMEDLRFVVGSKLIPVMASANDIKGALLKNYGPPGQFEASGAHAAFKEAALPQARSSEADTHIGELTAQLAAESAEIELDERHAKQNDTTLVKLVNKIILDAIEQKASDIHIESNPEGRGTRVRFRKDGVLITYLELPAKFRRAVLSRIKIMSQLDITERRRPQDGKIDFSRFGPARAELRVATIPTANGLEDVVMRLLSAARPVALDQLGFDAAALAAVKKLMSRRHGLFLVCGPTGSGKTTSLHSLLGHLNTEERKIWTAEDPIEIAQPGLRQVQVNPRVGWTFAAAMRSFMRADPDVIMVGEMRDAETAKTGIEASLTGHLVLSTLHTNSAPESVVRLLDLGMDPFNFADALLGVLSQRLVRRLCEHCKADYTPSTEELEQLALEYCVDSGGDAAALLLAWRKRHGNKDGAVVLYRAEGCDRCNHIGYQGRMGVYELLVADAAVKRLVQARAPIVEIRTAAMANGMRTLKQDGIDKILQGHTDLAQVRAV